MQMERIEVLIEQFVQEFARRNRFDAGASEFENVTPGRWNKQLNAACVQLAEELEELVECFEVCLHEGYFLK